MTLFKVAHRKEANRMPITREKAIEYAAIALRNIGNFDFDHNARPIVREDVKYNGRNCFYIIWPARLTRTLYFHVYIDSAAKRVNEIVVDMPEGRTLGKKC